MNKIYDKTRACCWSHDPPRLLEVPYWCANCMHAQLKTLIEHKHPMKKYKVVDGVLCVRVAMVGVDKTPLHDLHGEPMYQWAAYKGLCQGCRHPGDEHTCAKNS